MSNHTEAAAAAADAPQGVEPEGEAPAVTGKTSEPEQADDLPANPVFESLMGKVSFGILVLAVLVVGILFIMAVSGQYGPPQAVSPDPNQPDPPAFKLFWPWDAFMWLIASGGLLAKVIALLAAIVLTGTKVIARTTQSYWLAISVICLCLSGALLCVLLMWQLSGPAALDVLPDAASLADSTYKDQVNNWLIALACWFLVFLCWQLGINGPKLLAEAVKRATGGGK